MPILKPKPDKVHKGLAGIAKGLVKEVHPGESKEVMKQSAWEYYRQLTRYAAGCTRQDFYAWFDEQEGGGQCAD